MGIKVCDKSSGRGRKRFQLLLYRLLLLRPVGIFFLSIFQSAGKPLVVSLMTPNVSPYCVHVHTCAIEKTSPQKKSCLSRATHGYESKKQTEQCMKEQQKKMLSKQTPNSKNIDPAEMLQRGSGTGDDRDVHYPWGTASAR